MEDIQSQNWIEIGYRWFNLSSYRDLYHEVEEIMNTIICPMYGLREFERNGLQNVFIEGPNHPKYNGKALQEVFIPNDYKERPTEKYIIPDTKSWDMWRQERAVSNFVA